MKSEIEYSLVANACDVKRSIKRGHEVFIVVDEMKRIEWSEFNGAVFNQFHDAEKVVYKQELVINDVESASLIAKSCLADMADICSLVFIHMEKRTGRAILQGWMWSERLFTMHPCTDLLMTKFIQYDKVLGLCSRPALIIENPSNLHITS